MKTKEELTAPKEEVETVSRKQHDLTEEELAQVVGGVSDEAATKMRCLNPKCKKETIWLGDYLNSIHYQCPYCKQKCLVGVFPFKP